MSASGGRRPSAQRQDSGGASRQGIGQEGYDGINPNQLATDGQKNTTLAERRGNAPIHFNESPVRPSSESEGLFAKRPQRVGQEQPAALVNPTPPVINPYPDYHQQYWPPSVSGAGSGGLAAPSQPSISRLDSTASTSTTVAQKGSPPLPTTRFEPSGGTTELVVPKPSRDMNRLNSTASTFTTRAERGSPPPPETPISPAGGLPGGDIEARYAAAGIAGAATLSNLHGRNTAAAQRANQYAHTVPPRQQSPPRRPWTPTEQPGSQPYGPPTVYQGPVEVIGSVPSSAVPQRPVQNPAGQTQAQAQNGLGEDLQGMRISSSPPPAYSSVPHIAPDNRSYPIEKHGASSQAQPGASGSVGAVGAAPQNQQHLGHPAFANDPTQPALAQSGQDQHGQTSQMTKPQVEQAGVGTSANSLPPLPEGWMAHLDQNSGQYYYIHLPTQSTQWEFPKGPTPLNLVEPASPMTGNYPGLPLASPGIGPYGMKPLASPGLASPGLPPMTPGYAESMAGMGGLASPGLSVFSGPPPTSGVEMYNVAPSNGVYFGPYLRYANMDLERGIWLGSILLVTDAPQPPTIHIHQSVDLSPNRECSMSTLCQIN